MEERKFDLEKHPAVTNAKYFTAFGQREPDGHFEINYSSILTKLIQEAGRWCRSYASDLFVDWHSIDAKLQNGSMETQTFLFGFREAGVDHMAYVANKYENAGVYGSARDCYRALWRLDVVVQPDERRIDMRLYEISR